MRGKMQQYEIAVIIPISPTETSWELLLAQFNESEISIRIFLVMNSSEQAVQTRIRVKKRRNVTVLVQSGGRAELMNFASKKTKAKYLWFLHADSNLPSDYAIRIQEVIRNEKEAVFYFDLTFRTYGHTLMKLNTLGTYFRSHILKLPFGDQGFFLRKDLFLKLGMYKENLLYGEDHLLIWKAHHLKIPVLCIGSTLSTSARKYREHGWLKTTCLHLRLTVLQAAPEFIKKLTK
jgi:hypothetical protein